MRGQSWRHATSVPVPPTAIDVRHDAFAACTEIGIDPKSLLRLPEPLSATEKIFPAITWCIAHYP